MTLIYVLLACLGTGLTLLLCGRPVLGLVLWGLAYGFERECARRERRPKGSRRPVLADPHARLAGYEVTYADGRVDLEPV